MWKVTGKTIFPRWHSFRHTAAKYRKSQNGAQLSSLSSSANDKGSHGQSKSRQHAKREQHRFWDDPEFQCNLLRCNLLETVSLVGTAAICLDMQHKLWMCSRRKPENERKNCIFHKIASAMPHGTKCNVLPESELAPKINKSDDRTAKQIVSPTKDDRSIDSILKDLDSLTVDSIASMDNYFGIMFSKHDEKQAFDFFKASARLDCPKGLFNLAVCYEKGFGTKVDVTKAALYYKMSASKNHPYATYNLGVYFMQGLGGINQDLQRGLELIQNAAKMNVAEAQLYLGVRELENKNWSEAFTLFTQAAKQNNIDAQYFLGVCYDNGYGVTKNKIDAANMYAKAAANGQEDAILKLQSLEPNVIGGIDKDEDFSTILYNMIKDKKHEKSLKNRKKQLKPECSDKDPKTESFNEDPRSKPNVPTVLHSSSSVPELREYFSCRGNLDTSKSCSISFIHTIKTDRLKFHVVSGDINSSLDLATNSPLSSQLTLPCFVAASS